MAAQWQLALAAESDARWACRPERMDTQYMPAPAPASHRGLMYYPLGYYPLGFGPYAWLPLGAVVYGGACGCDHPELLFGRLWSRSGSPPAPALRQQGPLRCSGRACRVCTYLTGHLHYSAACEVRTAGTARRAAIQQRCSAHSGLSKSSRACALVSSELAGLALPRAQARAVAHTGQAAVAVAPQAVEQEALRVAQVGRSCHALHCSSAWAASTTCAAEIVHTHSLAPGV